MDFSENQKSKISRTENSGNTVTVQVNQKQNTCIFSLNTVTINFYTYIFYSTDFFFKLFNFGKRARTAKILRQAVKSILSKYKIRKSSENIA